MDIDDARAVIHEMLAELWGFDEVAAVGDDDHVPLGSKYGAGAIEVIDGQPPIVRVTMTAAVEVEPTLELLTVLNSITASSGTLSVHFEDGAVVVRRSDYHPVVDQQVLRPAMREVCDLTDIISPTLSAVHGGRPGNRRPGS